MLPSGTELNYVDGVTSNIQTQLNAKATLVITDSLAEDISGKASTTLNNLGTTSINASLIPTGDNVVSLGTSSLQWANLYSYSWSIKNGGVYTTTISNDVPTADRSIIIPDKSGTLALTTDISDLDSDTSAYTMDEIDSLLALLEKYKRIQ